MKTLAIVVPCYNEEETIHPFLEACQAVERQMANQLAFNYYFVNDGSKDRTLEVLRQVSKQFENVHYLSFSRNFGKEAGLLAGLEAAQGDYVTVMDADLQDPPELLIEMYAKIQEGYDVVGTRRADRKGEPPIRSARLVTTLSGQDVQTVRVSRLFVQHVLLRRCRDKTCRP